jgi:hypothetical protein
MANKVHEPNAKEAALAYLARGWAVIPVEPGGKRPLIAWEEFQHRFPEPVKVESWFNRWPKANLGIVTGKTSGLVVLDIDPRHDGDESLLLLEREHGPLPHSIEALTGGGGRHVYFRHPGKEMRNRVGLAPGIDLRGDGGMIVVPPSLHPSGKHYFWEVSHHPDETSLAPMPQWLESLIRGVEGSPGHPFTFWRQLVRAGVPEGERNSSIASLTGHMLWHGIDPEVTLELLLCWNRVRCHPPLSDEEVARTVESIRRTHFRKGGGSPSIGP